MGSIRSLFPVPVSAVWTVWAASLACIACGDSAAAPANPATTGTGVTANGSAANGATAGTNAGGSGNGDGSNGGTSPSTAGANGGGGPLPGAPGLDERPTNATCVAPTTPPRADAISLSRVFPSLSFGKPLAMQQAPGDSSHFYVLEQDGDIKRFENRSDVTSTETVVDLSLTTFGNDERGLLGMAFHPDFADNGYLYVSYTDPGTNVSHVDRYASPDAGATFPTNSRTPILELSQLSSNHNGGHIVFGPDGRLYIGFGDGGGANDPDDHGQNTASWFGSILRIDVDVASPYGVPGDNPFAAGGGAPEIFAYGLRNPWRFTFDRETGEMWLGDVGQNCFEEVGQVHKGDNLGWRVREGANCFFGDNAFDCSPDSTCSTAGLAEPAATYDHDAGISVTGGYVYRGARIPSLVGTYLYADFGTGTVWGVRPLDAGGDGSGGGDGGWDNEELLASGLNVASFAEDSAGELYVLDRAGGGIHRVEEANNAPPSPLPQRLSETGCVNPDDPTLMADGVLPYDLRVPFWSDGAVKERWFALPDGATFTVGPDGDWELPVGGVTIKTFWLEGRRIETRFMVRHADGSYGGYTYEWNAAGSDATLLDGAKDVPVGSQTWHYPSRSECMRCHTRAAGFSLGLESQQLDSDVTYPGGSQANQLTTLDHIGVLNQPLGTRPAALPLLDDTDASIEERARAYLHSNCAGCHQPNGPGRGSANLRFDATNLGVCDVDPLDGDLGIADARLLVAGDAAKSLLLQRARRRDNAGMPPLASSVIDADGTALLEEWINALAECP